MNLSRMILFASAAYGFPAAAQVFDNTGNGMLNGKYYFREVFFTATNAVAVYGNITFTSGAYTVSGTQAINCGQSGCSGPSAYATTGTYTISASGYGYISNQLLGSPVYGSVGANGVFIGSATESSAVDTFIAAPVASQSLSTLQGSYTLDYIDPTGALTQVPFDAQLQMSPNGSGAIGNVSVSAYASTSTPLTQSIGGVKYIVSNNAFVVQFPSSSASTALIQGNEYLYSTPDGSFVFGGSPSNFDMIVGVRTGTAAPGLAGLYYQGGMDLDNSSGNFDAYYGTFNANASTGAIIGHERIQNGAVSDYTYYDAFKIGSSTYTYTDTSTSTQYIIGMGGVRIGLGIGPFLGVSVAVPSPSLSGSGVYLNPVGVVNSASSAPFTAGVSRGELITLTGTNLGPAPLQVASAIPFPTTLGSVQVLINNVPAPIYYVSATQISAIVPWETTASIAQIQVVNNGVPSNIVTEYVNAATPGVFTVPAGGIGYAAAQHADFSLVTTSKPAQPGETIAIYTTGLGDVVPVIADGAAGVLSNTGNTIAVDIGGIAAPITYSGLAPGLAGLYQVNIQIPSGLTAGDNYLNIGNKNGSSYSVEALIPIGSGGSASSAESADRPTVSRRPQNASGGSRSWWRLPPTVRR